MSSSPHHEHLDATGDREVVFCHACSRQWYHDEHEHGLICPYCRSEATEIVLAENDPRPAVDNSSLSDDGGGGRSWWISNQQGTDSDPDDIDMEEHLQTGPSGFVMHERVFRSGSRPGSVPAGAGSGRRGPVDPADGNQILHRFGEMLFNDLGFRNADLEGRQTEADAVHEHGPPTTWHAAPPPTVHRTHFSGPGFSGGTASFTIVSGPPAMVGDGMDFDSMFRHIMINTVPPPQRAAQGGVRAGDGRLGIIETALQQLFESLTRHGNGVHGDVVYSQEALDRVITQLMEANPLSNAAPPASQSAIDRLERCKLTNDMVGPEGRAECTICMDSMQAGDEALLLPCRHWFHDNCVILWLREHNTCPICRHPIGAEGQEGQRIRPDASAGSQAFASAGDSRPANAPPPAPDTSRHRSPRTVSQNEERLAAIRAAGGLPPNRRTASGNGQMRRASLSPPQPSPTPSRSRWQRSFMRHGYDRSDNDNEHSVVQPGASRPRGGRSGSGGGSGSGSGSGDHSGRDQEGQGAGGQTYNPIYWLRDQFGRSSGSGDGSGEGGRGGGGSGSGGYSSNDRH